VKRSLGLVIVALALASPASAQPQGAFANALASGQAGERFDGYMGAVGSPPPELRRQLAAINLRRRNLYIELASRRNVSPDAVGLATACQLFASLPVGEAYLLRDAIWRRRAPGQAAPVPDYCR
jgi:uncharacterized protein YdbL (DUF1318 family)